MGSRRPALAGGRHVPYAELEAVYCAPEGGGSVAAAGVPLVTSASTGGEASGLSSLFLGSASFNAQCATCCAHKPQCFGHVGAIPLRTPVPAPPFVAAIKEWTRVLCLDCGAILVPPAARPAGFPDAMAPSARLQRLRKAGERYKKCWQCGGTASYRVVADEEYRTALRLRPEGGGEPEPIMPARLAALLEGLAPEDAAWLGYTAELHPRRYMWDAVPVIGNPMRPDALKQDGRVARDDMTNLYATLINVNDTVPEGAGEWRPGAPRPASPIVGRVRYLETVVYDAVRGSETNPDKPTSRASVPGGDARKRVTVATEGMQTLKMRMNTKFGVIRRSVVSRRAWQQGRSVVVNHPGLRLTEVEISRDFARTMQVRMPVTRANIGAARDLVENGRAAYPGCSTVVCGATGRAYSTAAGVGDRHLVPGDVLMRDLQDGDVVVLNRMPSLQWMSAIAMRVRVAPPGSRVIRFNVHICKPFNADFDGDEMQIWNPETPEAAAELLVLSGMAEMFVSYREGAPVLGTTYDSVHAAWALSREPPMARWQAMLMCNRTALVPDLAAAAADPREGARGKAGKGKAKAGEGPAADTFSGRDVLSVYLGALAPINYRARTKLGAPGAFGGLLRVADADRVVAIERGRVVSGAFDSAIVGEGKRGSIYDAIARSCGAPAALDAIFTVQQLGIGFMRARAHSIAWGDLMLSGPTRAAMRAIAEGVEARAAALVAQLLVGGVTPPVNVTVSEFVEQLLAEIMNVHEEALNAVLLGVDPYANQFVTLALNGAKGKLGNVSAILGMITAATEGGSLIARKFDYKRGIPLFRRCNDRAGARGCIMNSYASGQTLSELWHGAQSGRVTLIYKSLMTSRTGELYRDTVKNCEPYHVGHMREVLIHGRVVRQLYGNDGFDPRRVPAVECGELLASDAAFRAHLLGADGGKALPGGAAAPETRAAVARAFALRDEFRARELENQRADTRATVPERIPLPADAATLVRDALFASPFRDDAASSSRGGKRPALAPAAFARMLARVRDFAAGLPALYCGPGVGRGEWPAAMRAGASRLQTHLASALGPATLARLTPAMLEGVLADVQLGFVRALVAPGLACGVLAAEVFGEPVTQAMLNTTHLKSSSRRTARSIADDVDSLLRGRVDLGQPMYVVPRAGLSAERLAVRLERTDEGALVREGQIFAEQFGEPVHPRFAHERAFIRAFVAATRTAPPPPGLRPVCLRFVVDRVAAMTRSVTVEMLAAAVRAAYPSAYVVYSPETAGAASPLASPAGPSTLLLRVYFTPALTESRVPTLGDYRGVVDALLALSVRGLDNVDIAYAANAEGGHASVGADGAIVQEPRRLVVTSGSNFYDACMHPDVDAQATHTDSIHDILSVFGNEAARSRIERRIAAIVGVPTAYCHLGVFADAMTDTGRPVSLRLGLPKRAGQGVLLRASHRGALDAWTRAARDGVRDPLGDPSAEMCVGRAPSIGSNYSKLAVNEEFVRAHTRSVKDVLTELVGGAGAAGDPAEEW
jgi:DNA-directed RNA polymerase beta' subunit